MEKLWKRRRTKGFLLLTLLVPIISAILLAFLQNHTGVFGGLGSNLPMLMLSLFTFALLPLFLFMTAVDSFSGEVAARTLKLVLVRPISRTKVFASKVLAIAVYLAVHLGVLWIASAVSGWMVPGGEMAGGVLDSVKAYAASFVPMMAIGLIVVFIAQCFSSTTGAMATAIFIYAAAKLFPFVFPQFAVWSVFSYTNWYVLWVGNGMSMNTLLNTSVLLLSYCIIVYTAGWLLFDRKQL
ncbi:ABC transporter permease subunit [Brevibacillus sp. SYP-B805]|uniref:ABC transporter permease n=1 Tax=Brevibacillus sp. SYP-B805 TaxID=1578199 RepID=UPI0013EC9F7D|nr:ABC transporter permease [Brevibacillus sp. SYP-B805]NGQ97520.1 ABC transporter permease subunit [Brevibacillus sp. SYP-B805]